MHPLRCQLPSIAHDITVDSTSTFCRQLPQGTVISHCLAEWCAFHIETVHTLVIFIFEDILCEWGAVEKNVTDNDNVFIAALAC